jgi:hypothetical protein
VSKQFLVFVCPVCQTHFPLKGSKLRLWFAQKVRKPLSTGPYCCYKCSSRENVKKAIATKLAKNKAKAECPLLKQTND